VLLALLLQPPESKPEDDLADVRGSTLRPVSEAPT